MTQNVALMASTMRAEAVGDWEAAGDQFFSREQLYDMQWTDMDLESKRLCCAPFGGPIASIRDERAMVAVTGAGPAAPVVRLFGGAGSEAGSFLWERGRLAGWGWSGEQELVLVEPCGKVSFYSLQGAKLPKELSFGPDVASEGVGAVHVWPDGVVVMTAVTKQLWAAVGLREPRAARLAPIPGVTAGAPAGRAPAAARGAKDGGSGGGGAAAASGPEITSTQIAVIRPEESLSRCLEVLVAAGGAIWSVDERSATDQRLPPGDGGAAAVAVSPGGGFVAAFCGDGRLRVFASDFSRVISEFDTSSASPPLDLAWCGCDAVALRWDGLLLLAGPYGDWLRLPAAGPMALVSEVDGLRVVTEATHMMLRRVADPLLQVYRPGSTSPAATLWSARDYFDAGSARADRLLRDIRDSLPDAVRTCIDAAGLEMNAPRQRALMRAAAFGRPFCPPSFPPLLMRDVARKLRILNAVREPGVGLPLTMAQLEALTLPVLVSRLVVARHYLLAYRIADMLGGGRDAVAAHWACAKISASPSVPDAALREQLLARLRSVPGARFAPIAAHAQSVGRRSLAIRLLEEEPSPSLQVPLLISLARGQDAAAAAAGEEEDILGRALRRAVESGDPDLIYLTLFAAYKQRPLPQFWALVAGRAAARNLFVKYAKAKVRGGWAGGRAGGWVGPPPPAAGAAAAHAHAPPPAPGGGGGGRPDAAAAVRFAAQLERAAADGRREGGLLAKGSAEFASLVKEQARLERETGQALYVGLSLSDTLRAALRLGHHREATALRKQFAVPEPRWQWLKLRALVEARDWEALDQWAAEKTKGPAMGWDAVLDAAQRGGAPREYQARAIGTDSAAPRAVIGHMPDSAKKAEAFAAIDCPREAAEVAARIRDSDLFSRIQAAVAPGSAAGLAIAQVRERFASALR
ncbi:MAG: vacuolar protein sorting-associated protein 16 [Monoraphidium minutum]|nr:MAG: vacuolar protein sorting-associated protein 16 [Monoraphidium minutum]